MIGHPVHGAEKVAGRRLRWGSLAHHSLLLVAVSLPFADTLSLLQDRGTESLIAKEHVRAQRPTQQIDLIARTGERFRFDYEVVTHPDSGPLIRPIHVELNSKGRQYYLDEYDNKIKVFGPDNSFLFAFGGSGQAPGLWQTSTSFAINPLDDVYVWDQALNAFHVFDEEGDYLHRVHLPGDRLRAANVVWLSDTELIIGGLSLGPDYHGYFAHRFRVVETRDGAGGYVLEKQQSFLELPDIAPGLYTRLLAGTLVRDIDGGLLYAAARRHHVAKFAPTGDLLWTFNDPEVLPDAAQHLEATPSGRIRVTQQAASWGVLGTERWIIHQVWLEVRGLPEIPEGVVVDPRTIDPTSITVPKVIEIIDRESAPDARILVDTTADLWLRRVDAAGRLYGVVDFFDPIPIRGRLHLVPDTRNK